MDSSDFPVADVTVDSMTADTLKRYIDAEESITLLDVRMENEYETWAIEGKSVETVNIPYFAFLDDEIETQIIDDIPSGDPLVVVCAKGGASEFVAGVLTETLGSNVVNLEGGMNAWAALYEQRQISRYDGPGSVYQYHRPATGCLGYLVVSEGSAAVIDPLRAFAERYRDDASELHADLEFAVDTHVHADHFSGVDALLDASVTGIIPQRSADRGVAYRDNIRLAEDGDIFHVGNVEIEAVGTPGHTTDMTSYLIDDSLLLTGDGLFIESVARPDLEAGDDGADAAARQLYHSLHNRVLPLPGETLIGGAHVSAAGTPAEDGTYTARIDELRDNMDALSLDENAFVDLVLSNMPPRPAHYEEIIAANMGKHTVDDETAFELELGPNNCAASQESLITQEV